MSNKLPGDITLPSSQETIDQLIAKGEGKYKYSVEDFFKTPDKSAYALSPDGLYLAFLAPFEKRQNIFVQKIGEDNPKQITFEKERDIAGYGWANNERLIYIKDQGGDENFSLFAIDLNGENASNLTPFENVKIQIIDDLEDSDDEMIIGMNKNNPMFFEPYRINIKTGDIKQLATNDNPAEPISTWMTDHEGRLRIAIKVVNGVESTLLYRETENDEFQEIITTNFKENISPLFFDFEHDHIIYIATNIGRDKSVITQYDLNKKEEYGPIIFEHDEVDVDTLAYSKERKVLTFVNYVTDRHQYHFLDKQRADLQVTIDGLLAKDGLKVGITGSSKDETKLLLRTYSDCSLGSYYFYDINGGDPIKLVDMSPWLDSSDLRPMQAISYQTEDGLTINGYLTLPDDSNGPFPLIVNPHGGPWVRDTWRYNPEVQLLASHGFAVFQMNYRGSTGYGKKFWEAGFKQWGRKMQDDITEGVQYLIDKGLAQSDKVVIYGGSYGGYATLAGVTFTPDLYCCAIDYVGVSNLFTFMNTMPPYWKPYLKMMYEMVGHPEIDKEEMEAASPAFHVDKIKCPLFVVQGANDPRVNIDESDQIVSSLRARGVDVPYLVKYNEGHGFHNEENRIEFYKAMLGFLKMYAN